jgi:anti-anti-sigma regulatory factor
MASVVPTTTTTPASTPKGGKIQVAPTTDGCCVRIEGRGTMQESPAAKAIATGTLKNDLNAHVVVDLSACDYLDSTFLGCLVQLFRDYGSKTGSRFHIAGSADRRKKLLGPCHLDKVIPSLDAPPQTLGEWVPVPVPPVGSKDLARHIMECHKLLAELESPMRPAFLKIAEQLQRELNEPAPTPH